MGSERGGAGRGGLNNEPYKRVTERLSMTPASQFNDNHESNQLPQRRRPRLTLKQSITLDEQSNTRVTPNPREQSATPFR